MTGTVSASQHRGSSTLLWTAPEGPLRVTIPATVLDEIRVAVVEAFHSVPRGGVEIGGVFFRDPSGGVQADKPMQEFVIDPPDYGLAIVAPEHEDHAPSPPPVEKAPVDREIVNHRHKAAVSIPPKKEDFNGVEPTAPAIKA